MRSVPGWAVATAAVLAGCAGPTALPPPAAPPGPPPGVDGRYRGTARLVRGDRLCPRSGPRVYALTNGAVSLAYGSGRHRVELTADIQADGTFRASDGDGLMSGQLRDGLLEITITNRECEHRWTMRKVL